MKEENPNDWIDISVYVGERYIVKAFESSSLQGSARADIVTEQASVTIILSGTKP